MTPSPGASLDNGEHDGRVFVVRLMTVVAGNERRQPSSHGEVETEARVPGFGRGLVWKHAGDVRKLLGFKMTGFE